MCSRNLQNGKWQCDVHELRIRNTLWYGRRFSRVDLWCVSPELQLAGDEYLVFSVHVQRRALWPTRRSVLAVRRWDVQGHKRQCCVYELCCRNILGFCRRFGGDELSGVPREFQLAGTEHGRGGLRLQRGVHRTERGPMRSVRGWDV